MKTTMPARCSPRPVPVRSFADTASVHRQGDASDLSDLPDAIRRHGVACMLTGLAMQSRHRQPHPKTKDIEA